MAQMMVENDNPRTEHRLPDDRHGQLLDLVGELLLANQELRFKVAQLERKAERLTHAVEESATVYGLLMP